MKINCLIIDDEPLARKRLFNLVKDVQEFDVLDQCKTGKEAILAIDGLQPDLIFLDIQMKDMSGFDVLKNIKTEKKPLVIFVTAFDTYAVKAFDFLAFDYLLKPFKKERFQQAVDRAMAHFTKNKDSALDQKFENLLRYIDNSASKNNEVGFKNKIPVRTGNVVSFIDAGDIRYVVASGSYIDINTAKKVFVHRSSLHHFLNEIGNNELLRIHRSTIINVNFIDKVIHSNYGEIDVKMKDERLFRISKSYRKSFQNIVGI